METESILRYLHNYQCSLLMLLSFFLHVVHAPSFTQAELTYSQELLMACLFGIEYKRNACQCARPKEAMDNLFATFFTYVIITHVKNLHMCKFVLWNLQIKRNV